LHEIMDHVIWGSWDNPLDVFESTIDPITCFFIALGTPGFLFQFICLYENLSSQK